MKENSDFLDAINSLLYSSDAERLDISDDFYRVDDFSKKSHVKIEEIIDVWLSGKINIYVYLRSVYCRINRYPNKEENRYDTSEIAFGRDFYQDERSPQDKIRKFIPCKKESEIKEYIDFSGSSSFKYVYNGYASGYWRLQPTGITHLVRDNYNLKNANDEWVSIPGEVDVFGRDKRDYLLFNTDIYISFEQLYISSSDFKIIKECFSYNENSEMERYDPPYNRIAMVLLINKIFSVNGHVTYSNVSTALSSNGINVGQTTIKKVLEETFEKRDKPYKIQPQHSRIAACLITLHCKSKNIPKTPSNVARILNDFVKSSPREWCIVFTPEIAANIMKIK
ncbi:hypothetical protein [Dickeya oryzae]|uniref:hypothetical protein n=1 Tax=Dickeya oryzae TaxID=1240404 RepID=UPI00129748E9|nr:hypothetical protein [Dickeya oryzae]